jgi:hypothetical protein
MRGSLGRAYYDRKIAEGKTRNEAMRCLKRRLADHVWRTTITDERTRARAAGPGRQPGATLTYSAAGSTPTTSSSDKSLPRPPDLSPRPRIRPLEKHRGELPPVVRTPDLTWPRPPGRMPSCRLPTRKSSVVVPSSSPVRRPSRSPSWRRNCASRSRACGTGAGPALRTDSASARTDRHRRERGTERGL